MKAVLVSSRKYGATKRKNNFLYYIKRDVTANFVAKKLGEDRIW